MWLAQVAEIKHLSHVCAALCVAVSSYGISVPPFKWDSRLESATTKSDRDYELLPLHPYKTRQPFSLVSKWSAVSPCTVYPVPSAIDCMFLLFFFYISNDRSGDHCPFVIQSIVIAVYVFDDVFQHHQRRTLHMNCAKKNRWLQRRCSQTQKKAEKQNEDPFAATKKTYLANSNRKNSKCKIDCVSLVHHSVSGYEKE